jgi:hypothetical protein
LLLSVAKGPLLAFPDRELAKCGPGRGAVGTKAYAKEEQGADQMGEHARFGIGLRVPDCWLSWDLGEDGYLSTL